MQEQSSSTPTGNGFTLLEILLTITILAVLAGITISALNPRRQLADARNTERKIEISTVLNAVHQYALDNYGTLPANIPTRTLSECIRTSLDESLGICRSGQLCTVTLSELTENKKYLNEIPVDPVTNSETLTGYNIVKNSDNNNRVTICAPGAENGETIYIPR